MRLELEAIHEPTSFEEYDLVNMVYFVSLETSGGIDIPHMWTDNMHVASWSPGSFPGMLMEDKENGVKFRFF